MWWASYILRIFELYYTSTEGHDSPWRGSTNIFQGSYVFRKPTQISNFSMSAYFGAHTHRTVRQVLCLPLSRVGSSLCFQASQPSSFSASYQCFSYMISRRLGITKKPLLLPSSCTMKSCRKVVTVLFLVPVEKTHHWLEDLRPQGIYKETYISRYRTWMDLDLWNRWVLSHTALKFGLLSPAEALSCVFCLQLLPTDPCSQSSQASIFIQGTNKRVQRSSTKVWMPYKPICAHALHISNQASQSIFHVMNMAKLQDDLQDVHGCG